MKINPITFESIKQNNSLKRTQNFKTNPLAMDTFEKTNVSFKGPSADDILDKLANDFVRILPLEFLQSLSDEMLDNLVTGNFSALPVDFLRELEDKEFADLLKGIDATIDEFKNILEYEKAEAKLGAVLSVFTDKKMREKLRPYRTEKIEPYLDRTLHMYKPDDREFMISLFKNSGGIKNVANLELFFQTYSRNPKPFKGQGIESVEMYGILKNKDDLSKYGELLLYLFNEEYEKEVADYEILNRTTAFLKQMGLSDFDNFDEKFSHLKSKFNNFEDVSDKAEAIEYLEATYEHKTQLLDEILKQNPTVKSFNAEKLYTSINDIVDYFHEKNGQKSLAGLSDIIEFVAFSNKLKPIGLKQLSHNFNEFENTEDKVNFYRFLKEENISIPDFNSLVGKNIISDIDTTDFFLNKEELTERISQIKGLNAVDSFTFYSKFKDVINAAHNEETTNIDEIKTLINVVDRFKLKDSSSFIEFYNKATGIKKKTITSDELKEFIELFKYIDSPKLLEDARKQNTTAIALLQQEKEKFLAIKDDIELFMIEDEQSYFAGETALNVFKTYRETIIENPTDVNTVLQNIVNFNIAGQEEYKIKAAHIEKFSTFFDNKEDFMKFLSYNNITFDGSKEDNERIENSLIIFNSLYDEKDIEQSKQRINYYAESGFITKSEKKLTDFLSQMPSEETKKTVLSLIADKKIPSLIQMEKFFKQYQTENTTGRDLIKYLNNLPENIDFNKSISTLEKIQSRINQYNLPINLTGDDITSIDIAKYHNFASVSTSDMVSVLNNVYQVPEGENFLGMISKDNEQTDTINSYRIAKEIAIRIDKSRESYQNISRLLEIDRESLGLEENCSSYIYARAIQNKLPKEFIDFVKSEDWLKYANSNKTADITFHARLRAIDRFALEGIDNIKELYTESSKEKLKALIQTVYTSCPTEINGNGSDKRIVVDFNHNNREVEAVFSQNGKMLTIVPKRTGKTA